MLEPGIIKSNIKNCKVTELSQSVQGFYNGSCSAIDLDKTSNVDEIIEIIKIIVEKG
jgi:hypothetical protein